MFFGVDYHPEHWVYPYAGTVDEPEARWSRDVELMLAAGVNAVRMGEFAWGLYEPEEGRYEFAWMRRIMDLMHQNGISVVLGTPTAAPPLWLSRKHPEILPLNEKGQRLHEGTRHAYCLNSEFYWEYTKKIVRAVATQLGSHPALIAWQVDNGIGGHLTESSFNEDTEHDWHAWLRAKYETVARMNDALGLRFWGQTVQRFEEVPMPRLAPTVHNPALMMDWYRFSSDTIIAYMRCQAHLLREITPMIPVTTNLRALTRQFDHFDLADVLDFVSADANATIKSRSAENACEVDIIRSFKKGPTSLPGEESSGFWVIEQKAGQVNWHDVNSLVRPGVVRLFAYQVLSRGANGLFYFFWRQPRIGSEQFYGGVLTHDGRGDNRVYQEVRQIGLEMKLLGPILKHTKVVAETAILFTHDNDWSQKLPMQPNKHFKLRDHIQLFHTALHDRNIPVDFARPLEDLSRYKIVFAPSLQLLSGAEADALRLYVQNGGTLVATCNTGLFDENHTVPDNGMPKDLTDVFGLEVEEFDPVPPNEENHLSFKGDFHVSALHPARLWCDVIKPLGAQVLGIFTRDFYANRPAMTVNNYGTGRAIYIGFTSHQPFYYDLVVWLRQITGLFPLLKVPDTVEVSLRQGEKSKIFFLLNHQNSPVRIQFYKPMHDFLTGRTFSGNYDLPPHGILVLDEHPQMTPPAATVMIASRVEVAAMS
jgi:beta-galactosidase